MGSDRDSYGAAAAATARHGGNRQPQGTAGFALRSGESNDGGPSSRKKPRPLVLPAEVERLIHSEGPERDKAWEVFVATYSRLLIHVARKVMPAPESAMDAYADILDRLRRNNCRAIVGYAPSESCQFTTWLVVVTRRMCVDFYRQQYGRPRGEDPSTTTLQEREARRRLATFAGVEDLPSQIADQKSDGPERAVRIRQLQQALDSAIATLQPEDQLLLKLRFHDGLPAQQIAPILKYRSQFHVYRRLKSVCVDLRRVLLTLGVEDGIP